MHPFRRTRGRFVASFESGEVALLADLVDQVRQLLAERGEENPVDPLVELTGITVGPSTAPEDPALARLLPDFARDDQQTSAALRALHEPDLIAQKDAAAVAVLDSLPRGGGTVRLTEDVAKAWLSALNDVRLALGVRLEVTEDDVEPPTVGADPDGQAAAAFGVYRWLTYVQDSLVTQMLGTT